MRNMIIKFRKELNIGNFALFWSPIEKKYKRCLVEKIEVDHCIIRDCLLNIGYIII